MVRIEITYEQWDILHDMVEDQRDSWARVVAGAVVDGVEKDRLNRYADKYGAMEALYRKVLDGEAC